MANVELRMRYPLSLDPGLELGLEPTASSVPFALRERGKPSAVCWPQNPFWGLLRGGFPSSLSRNAERIPPCEVTRKGFRVERNNRNA